MKLCFCDCETTGLYVDAGHEAWEVAVLVVDGEEITERTWQLPVDVSKADPMALAMNGWYDRRTDASHLTPLDSFARSFMKMVHGATLIGAVPSFDERFLTKALQQGGGVPCWHYQPVDVETLAVGWAIGAADLLSGYLSDSSTPTEDLAFIEKANALRTPPWDSNALSDLLGVDPGQFERHSAMGDVLWARAIWGKIMGSDHG